MTDSQSLFRRQVAVLQSQVAEVIRHQVYLSEQKEPHKPFPLSPQSLLLRDGNCTAPGIKILDQKNFMLFNVSIMALAYACAWNY